MFDSMSSARLSVWVVLWTVLSGVLAASVARGQERSQSARASAPVRAGDTQAAYVQTAWTVEDGLPVNAVNDLARTPDGYLWIATYDGLVRFDGVRFQVYRSSTHPGLPSSRILTLHVHRGALWLLTDTGDAVRMHKGTFETQATPAFLRLLRVGRAGTLWAGTDTGLARWVPGRGFVAVRPDAVTGLANDVAETADGALWVGTSTGLFRYAPDGSVNQWTPPQTTPGERVYALATAADSMTVWVASQHPREQSVVQPWTANGRPDGAALLRLEGALHDMAPGPDGRLWAATSAHLYRIGLHGTSARGPNGNSPGETDVRIWETGAMTPSSPVAASPPRFAFDGAVWTHAGRVLYRNDVPILTARRAIRAVQPGPDGVLWVGTADRLVQLHPSRVTTWGTPEGLADENVYPIVQRQDGSIWAGGLTRGVARIDSSGVTTFNTHHGQEPLGSVFALHEGRSGRFWIAGTRFCRFANGRCVHGKAPFPWGVLAYALHEDRQGRLWMGTTDGLYMRADATDETLPWTHFTSANSALPHDFVRVLVEDASGALWLGTNGGGLARYRNGRFAAFTEADGLPSNRVRDIRPDPTGAFWIVTEDQGLARIVWDPSAATLQADSLAHVTTADGLFDNALHRLLPDDQGRFWMSSNRGLFWVRRDALEAVARGKRADLRSVAYTTQHGLRNAEANGGSHPAGTRAADGRLWFPTQAGAVVVNPNADPVSEAPPNVVVETLTPTDGPSVDVQGTSVGLPPDQRDLALRYTGIHFRHPESLQFRYRLLGFNDAWTDAGARREAFFTQVPPGRYTFEVSARTARSGWSPPATQAVRFAPHVYETGWFALIATTLGLLGLGGALYAGMRYRLRTLRRREQVLSALVEKRTADTQQALAVVRAQADALAERNAAKARFFTNVSHELRTPLTLILGPAHQLETAAAYSIDKRRTLARTIRENGERLQTLSTQLLDLAKHDEGRLRPTLQRHALAPFLRVLKQRFAHRARTCDCTLTLEVTPPDAAAAFDADQMETIVVNLLDNALRHTPAGGTVRLCAQVEANTATLAVHDTGPGIPADIQAHLFERFYQQAAPPTRQGSTGIGLALVRALAHMHGGTVQVDSAVGAGATFTVTWPASPPNDDRSQAEDVTEREDGAVLKGDGQADAHTGIDLLPPTLRPTRGRAPRPTGAARKDTSGPPYPDDVSTVLLVEDHPEMRAFIRSILAPAYRVVEARTGRDGIRMAQETLPDCIVSDVMMPQLDGIGMVEALRTTPATECIPVVLLTARGEAGDHVSGIEAGADVYVPKPFHPDVLHAHVDRCIAAQHRLRDRLRAEVAQAPPSKQTAPSEQAPSSEDDAGASEAPCPPNATADAVLEHVGAVVTAHMHDPDFAVSDLVEATAMSRRALERLLKAETGQTPNALIRRRRLECSAELLQAHEGTIAEIAYAVGFNSHSYFSRCFKQHFGCTPSAYVEEASLTDG